MTFDQTITAAIAKARKALEGCDYPLEVLDDYAAAFKSGHGDWRRLISFLQGLSAAGAMPIEDFCEVSGMIEKAHKAETDYSGTPASRRAQLVEALEEFEAASEEYYSADVLDLQAHDKSLKRYELAQTNVTSIAKLMNRFGYFR